MSTLVYDIEVAGQPFEEVDAVTRDYLLDKVKDPADREALPERMALYPGLGKVVAIGLWNVEADRGLLLLEGSAEPQREWENVANSEILRGSERELLAKFWEITARQKPRFVTFNGRGYDGPMLMVRSAQHGLRCERDLIGYRYDISEHVDLMDVLSFQGARRENYSLEYWCQRFGVESPKGGIDGSQVGRYYREGRLEEIGEYCLRDVHATAALYAKLAGSFLHLFRGGPRPSN